MFDVVSGISTLRVPPDRVDNLILDKMLGKLCLIAPTCPYLKDIEESVKSLSFDRRISVRRPYLCDKRAKCSGI